MGFRSVNEMHNFKFDDCEVHGVEFRENSIILILEALIVKDSNSQNSNFTNSYAGTARLEFREYAINGACEAGCKVYNADNVLIDETEDIPISTERVMEVIRDFQSIERCYLCSVDCIKGDENADNKAASGDDHTEKTYLLEFELPLEDEVAPKVYDIMLAATDAIVTWEVYMNRVQN